MASRKRRSWKLSRAKASTRGVEKTPKMPALVLKWLRRLRSNVYGRPVDQLSHSLQTATLAVCAGADEDLVVTALCHDIGKGVSWSGHGKRSADILKPYVSPRAYRIVATHHDFLAIYNVNRSGLDPYAFRDRHSKKRWYCAAITFADDWDSIAYDPAAKPIALRYFVPLIRRVFAVTRRRSSRNTGYELLRRLESVRKRRKRDGDVVEVRRDGTIAIVRAGKSGERRTAAPSAEKEKKVG